MIRAATFGSADVFLSQTASVISQPFLKISSAITNSVSDFLDRFANAEENYLRVQELEEELRNANDKLIDYEQTKREKEAKKNQHVVEIKEVRLSLGIDTHDFETKVNHAKRFLTSGNKVKVSIRFRGREMAHTENGLVIMKQFSDACEEFGNVEKAAKLEGKSMMMFLAKKKKK